MAAVPCFGRCFPGALGVSLGRQVCSLLAWRSFRGGLGGSRRNRLDRRRRLDRLLAAFAGAFAQAEYRLTGTGVTAGTLTRGVRLGLAGTAVMESSRRSAVAARGVIAGAAAAAGAAGVMPAAALISLTTLSTFGSAGFSAPEGCTAPVEVVVLNSLRIASAVAFSGAVTELRRLAISLRPVVLFSSR